ncbi:MAG: Rpn family recombination-promoting nuclease/putative transposase [bacterium]
MPFIHLSHDAYFKLVFSRPEVAADALRRLLPGPLAAAIDWDRLELLPGEFVDEDLSGHRADLVFRVPLRGQTAFVFVLYEHQSSVDPMMPFRVLVYMVGIWKTWRRDNPDARHLPPIVPVVLYNGERPWSAPLDFHALFATDPALLDGLARHLPAFEVLIDDLARTDDDTIERQTRRALATVALIMLRHGARDPDLVAVIERLSRHLSAVAAEPGGLEALRSTLYYALCNDALDPRLIARAIASNVDPEVRAVMVSTAQQLYDEGHERGREEGREEGREAGREEGREEGREAGREEGREEGRDQAEALMLHNGLRYRFGAVPDALRARIEAATHEERDRWFQRLFTAATLADVFTE